MIDRKTIFDRIGNSHNLPSPPQILIRLVEACDSKARRSPDLLSLVAQDPALSTKLLMMGTPDREPSPAGQDVPSLMQSMDLGMVKYIAINASVQQTFEDDRQDTCRNVIPFWRHSMHCALLARGLADTLAYESIEDAYFAGLLHDIGKLMLKVNFPDIYSDQKMGMQTPKAAVGRDFEQNRFGVTHDEIGAWIIRQAGLDSFLADAVHYHHEPTQRIRDALPLVQILHSAHQLCYAQNGQAKPKVEEIARILNTPARGIHSIVTEANEKLNDVARNLDIHWEAPEGFQRGTTAIPADTPDIPLLDEEGAEADLISFTTQNKLKYLSYEVRDFSLLYGTLQNLLTAHSKTAILEVIQRATQILFGVKQSLIFFFDPEQNCLTGTELGLPAQIAAPAGICIDCRNGRSILSRSLNSNTILDSFGHLALNPGTIVEEQITRRLGTEGVLCVPLTPQGRKLGVLVLGITQSQFRRLSGQLKLLNLFADHAATCLHVEEMQTRHAAQIQIERLATAENMARNVVQEVNNPLGVMRNHLHLLGQKLSPEDPGHEDIGIITEEIRRVAEVMDQLTAFAEPQPAGGPAETVAVPDLITTVVNDLRHGLPIPQGIDIRLDLDSTLPPVPAVVESLRTILQHLLTNAVEAMGDAGEIIVRTRRISPRERRAIGERRRATGSLEVLIQDNGPGIPESVRERLFEPYTTTKGGSHTGMGLSIVQNLIRQLGGHIICETDAQTGTRFRIILSFQ